jgi:hypothetical protein
MFGDILSNDIESLKSFYSEFKDSEILTNPALSLESIMSASDINIGNHEDIMKFRATFSKSIIEKMVSVEYQVDPVDERERKVPDFIKKSKDKCYTAIIDFGLLISMLCYEFESFFKFVNQIASLEEDDTLYVYCELPFSDVNYFILFDGVALANIIKSAKCTTVFKCGTTISFSDLIFASRCDKIDISDFAMLSIVRAEAGQMMSRYLTPPLKYLVKSTYAYWTEAGLITHDEILGLFSDEAEFSIFVMGAEMRKRLSKKNGGLLV